MEWIHELFQQYGYYVLLVGLLLEYIALPFPGEPTLAYAGFLSHQGDLNLPILIMLSFIGTSVGMTFQYFLGNKLGMPFIQKYGKYVFLTQKKIDMTKIWFDTYGYFLIFIAFFIPGVRHFTGYFAGIINLPFRRFAMTIYSGALFWVSFFLIGGYWLGENLEEIFQILGQHIWKILFGMIIITLITRFRKNIKHMILKLIN
ncbi:MULTISPECIES: DedA family protein [unclassified Bacillus (in: firmicutes)]|uniref:DedA family protein n=1 Tax=unclassified Bacillus (in: firmicutes) TaxID=185979 RepID=UPI00032F6286|nr:DedA family protein [Bacillus wiedmannii]EOP06228.1 alkaline phosphatase [Bacillus cereus BAG2O-3]EOQ14659.1 alkaline phosphatase [Bacillus cereus B5-2]MDA1601731.1 DedA family protein [Bacillus cereus]RFB48253.1 DedA family protein [Bacillus sp. dmp10]RFB71479.1 DedA family protein [Bacillus sp. AW]HDR8169665.1 DedA family protein [Bacillus thuringiensis]